MVDRETSFVFDSTHTTRLISSSCKQTYLGWVFLVISFAAGCVVMYRSVFVDEADNLATGALLTRGYLLYRDVFSHHFPFAYYWSTAVQEFFGQSIFAIRLSVILFQISAFIFAMRTTGYVLSLGLASLIWNIIGYMQLGNLLLYNVFSGVSCMVIFALVLAIITQKRLINWRISLAIGIFSAIAILSDPLTIYPLSVAFITLTFSQGNSRHVGLAIGVVVIVVAIYAVYLLITDTYTNFWDNTIIFNMQVYGKYIRTDPMRLKELIVLSLQGFRIVDFARENPIPLWPLPPPSARTMFDGWLFTGFLYRFAIILSVMVFIMHRKVSPALFLYFGTAALLVISQRGFHAHGFTLVSLSAVAGLVTGDWINNVQNRQLVQKLLLITIRGLLGCMAAWLVVRVATYTIQHRASLTYEANFAGLEAEATRIRTILACNISDVRLGYYPGEPMMYWLTGMKPVSRYLFMWPWVAEIGLYDVLESLSTGLALVYVDDTVVWGQKTQDYLHELLIYLNQNYISVGSNWYMSPALAAKCPP